MNEIKERNRHARGEWNESSVTHYFLMNRVQICIVPRCIYRKVPVDVCRQQAVNCCETSPSLEKGPRYLWRQSFSPLLLYPPCWEWWLPLGSLQWCWTCPPSLPQGSCIPTWRSQQGPRHWPKYVLSQHLGRPARKQKRTTYLGDTSGDRRRWLVKHLTCAYFTNWWKSQSIMDKKKRRVIEHSDVVLRRQNKDRKLFLIWKQLGLKNRWKRLYSKNTVRFTTLWEKKNRFDDIN